MITSVKKWGNSLGIRIPKSISEEILINEGSKLTINVKNGIIELAKANQELCLEDLLAEIHSENLHGEIETGLAKGNEL